MGIFFSLFYFFFQEKKNVYVVSLKSNSELKIQKTSSILQLYKAATAYRRSGVLAAAAACRAPGYWRQSAAAAACKVPAYWRRQAAAACRVPAYWRRTPEWCRIRRPAFCPEICRSQTCVPMLQHRHRCGTDSMRLAANSAKNYCCCFYYKLEISFSFHA